MDWYIFYYSMILANNPECTLLFDDFIDECDSKPALVIDIQNYLTTEFQKQGQLERPFILFEDGKPAYIFFATMDGPGGFENASRSWNMVIPIKDRK